jgi:CobQ-like glutamine amidotransferase family enzyme
MEINIGWLYPDLMSTYGDRGNIIALSYRLKKRGIKSKIIKISLNEPADLIKQTDLIFMGGAQDNQQEIVNQDLLKNKGRYLLTAIERSVPGLYVCGAYQFLGKYYQAADGTKIFGLGIFDLYTINPGINAPRMIGNIVTETKITGEKVALVGFENHGGRTYLNHPSFALAHVIFGYGNNGDDKTEGFVFKNSIGTYLHGPILPKNPQLTDFLITKALERKYQKPISLLKIDDDLEDQARKVVLTKRTKRFFYF